MATDGKMVGWEDETRSSPDFEEFELIPNTKDSEVCGVWDKVYSNIYRPIEILNLKYPNWVL
jgi:hypothetical protein